MRMMSVKASVVAACMVTVGILLTVPSGAGIDLQSASAIWLLDDGAGNTATDFTQKGNDGDLIKGPFWVDGKFGGALEFDGASSYVMVEEPVDLPVLWDSRTVLFWFKWASVDFRAQPEIVGWGWDGPSKRNGVVLGEAGGIGYECSGFRYQYLAAWEGDTDWHHFAMTVPEGERTKNDAFTFYFDGEEKAGEVTAGKPQILLTENAQFTIGCYNSPLGHYFSGLVDEVAIFPRALTGDEIKEIMKSGLLVAQDVTPQDKLTTTWAQLRRL